MYVQFMMDKILCKYPAHEVEEALEADRQPGVCRVCREVTDLVPRGSDHNTCDNCGRDSVISASALYNKGASVDL